jgi:hypothetical protein
LMYIKLKLNASALTAVSYFNTTEFFITLLAIFYLLFFPIFIG